MKFSYPKEHRQADAIRFATTGFVGVGAAHAKARAEAWAESVAEKKKDKSSEKSTEE